jgi:copper resistance protein B
MSTQLTSLLNRCVRRRIATLGLLLGCMPAVLFAQQADVTGIPVGVPGHGMLEDPFNRSLLFDALEARDGEGATDLYWDMSLWTGRSLEHLTVRTEGERRAGSTERAELQLLWRRAVAPWWETVVGARTDFAPGSGKNWAAFGVQGLAPYRLHIEATGFVSSGGDTALRVEAEYELLIARRLILQPQLELNWYGQSDVAREYGAGLSSGELGLRLRYEVRREVAPYVGIVRERRWGGSATGRDAAATSVVAGVRLRF